MLADWRLGQLRRIVYSGGVIAYPTEAVWGLGCHPFHGAAVERLLQLKQRPVEKGLILVAGDIQQFDFLLWDLPHSQQAKLQLSWPGPNTWLVPHQGRLPEWITGRHATVALRVSAHPLIQQLCAACGPLVSTSANPAGRPAARTRLRVEQYFHGQLDAIVPGTLGSQRNPSIIRDLQTDAIIRSA
ncbi:MAG: L-threonylcarbamoyladenylate synthase [Gammaproteobacteria bacterium]|nr:L-threonylcarbamoyladenylate synthase [Gammaproteobacteria bacterium]